MLRNLLDISEVVASDLPGMLPVWPFLPNQAIAQELFMTLPTLRPYYLTLSTKQA